MKGLVRVMAVAALASLGCSSGSGNGGTGGAVATGGSVGSGGTGTGTGGSTGGGAGGSSTGGSAGGSTGGATGTGGTTATGGAGGSTVSGTGGHAGAGGAGATGSGGAAGSGGHGGAGAGGGSATGGTGGAGGGASGPVTPVLETGTSLYKFAVGDLVMEVDASTGGRVSSLSLGGTNLMVAPATDATTWGSVFWPSPRSSWTPDTWPPPPELDTDPYTAAISGNDLVLTGMTDTAMSMSMLKDYAVDGTTGWITMNYTIKSTKSQKAAPWEVTRVKRGGMVFFPAGSTVTPGPLKVTQSNGIVWFDDSAMTATSTNGDKLTADGAMGWDAYVLGSTLFLKKFTDTPANQQPTGEGEICIYPGATWIEYEVQGPYTQISANGTLPWKMQWKVVKIPSSVTVAVGSASLVTFAEQQAAN